MTFVTINQDIDPFPIFNLNSIESTFGFFDISLLLLGNVDEVDGSVVSHNGQPIIFRVESDGLVLLVHLDFRQAQVAVPIFVKHFHEGQPRLCIFGVDILVQVSIREPELSSLNAFLDCFPNFEKVHTRLGRGACQQVLRWVEQDTRDLGLAISPS